MQTIAVSTVVRRPPAEVFDFLRDFTRYSQYSKYLERVERHGDGDPGTQYDLHFAWWKLTYTARSRVTDLDRPRQIDWEIVGELDAHGRWEIEDAAEEDSDAAEGGPGAAEGGPGAAEGGPDAADETATADAPGGSRVRFVVTYDPRSVTGRHLDLPRFVPLDYVVDRVVDLIVEEGERVVERVVADLEGERRPVELVVERDSVSG